MKKDKKEPKKNEDAALKAEIKALRERLLAQQQQIREAKLPIIVLIEGWDAAGKGGNIRRAARPISRRARRISCTSRCASPCAP